MYRVIAFSSNTVTLLFIYLIIRSYLEKVRLSLLADIANNTRILEP